MIKGIPFIIGCWIPYLFGWTESLEFPVSATIVIFILILNKTIKAI